MKKRFLACALVAAMVLSACSLSDIEDYGEELMEAIEQQAKEYEPKKDEDGKGETAQKPATEEFEVVKTSLLGEEEETYYDPNIVPSVPSYSVNADFSNVVYEKDFNYLFFGDDEADALRNGLIKNNFAVQKWGNSEFFDIYEGNRYVMFPSFVTVDSLMHTYHLYFAHLMKKSEKNYLAGELKTLSSAMLEESAKQYQELKGSEWEEAARRNVAFFYIGSKLLDESTTLPVTDGDLSTICESEINKIMAAAGITTCALTDRDEDYSQYKPRGYYEGDDELEHYFRSMMWYGRIAFELDKEDLAKSALLQTVATESASDKWESIYKITSFFAGASDDPGYPELKEIITEVCGENPSTQDLTKEIAFKSIMSKTSELKLPAINSIPVMDGENPIIPSYRFMGQRFTVDAAIMQRLVYSAVEENSNGDYRYLPDTLDTAAALGSETAYKILEQQGDTDYKNYVDNLTVSQAHFNNDNPEFWNASLYAGWLNTLRPLFEEKGEGYPSYMQSEEWNKKNLETYAGSYAELKHDTILYAKQVMAEMGGGDMDPLDDRGYVDPQPVIYSRFAFLSTKTKEGLEGYGMIDDQGKEDLDRLSEIALRLLSISEKELQNQALTEDDYEFIRCYGGNLEHFWYEANKDGNPEGLSDSYQAPCPIIADIATDPNGAVLEVGTGNAGYMYVVFPIDGELHVGRGSVYSFYQFAVPMSNRLTDSEWRNMLSGGYMDDDWNWVETEGAPDKPEWTMSYRVN
jgi:hypothetical protein